jgi:hypothetical protein
MKTLSLMACLCFLAVGCQTIHIKNGPQGIVNYQDPEWHHIGVIDLVEFSDAVDLNKACNGKEWTSIRTRQSVGQVFLGLVPYLSTAWSPREVSIACQ